MMRLRPGILGWTRRTRGPAAAGVVVCWRPLWETVSIHFEDPGRLAAVVAAVVVLTAVTLFGWRLVRDRLAGS